MLPCGHRHPVLPDLGGFLKANQKVRFLDEVSQVSKCCSGRIQPTGHEFVSPASVRQLFPFSLLALCSPTWLSGYPEDVDLSQMGPSQEATPSPTDLRLTLPQIAKASPWVRMLGRAPAVERSPSQGVPFRWTPGQPAAHACEASLYFSETH